MEGFNEDFQQAQRMWDQIKSDQRNSDTVKRISSGFTTADEVSVVVLTWHVTKERLRRQEAREREGWALACVLGLWVINVMSIWPLTTCLALAAFWSFGICMVLTAFCFPLWVLNRELKGCTILPLPTYNRGKFAYWLLTLHISMACVYAIAVMPGMVSYFV
jgi:hypothetical protein